MDIRPAIGAWYYCGVNKGAPNTNAANIFCGFMADQVAFDIWAEKQGRQNIYDPSPDVGKIFAQNEDDVILLDNAFAKTELEEQGKKYRPILGFK